MALINNNVCQDQFYEVKVKFTNTTVKGQEGLGLRVDINMVGEVSGKLNGQLIETASVTLYPDGSGTGINQGYIATKKGDMILTQGIGVGKATAPGRHSVRTAYILKTESSILPAFNNIMVVTEFDTLTNKKA